MIQSRLKKIVNTMSEEQVMRAKTAIMNIKEDVSADHPQYWVFDMIEMLFDTRVEALNDSQSIVDLAV
jgi:predicted ATP-dependent serine protease